MSSDVLVDRVVGLLEEFFGEDLRCIVLYGSRARGVAGPDSDWDFFVVAEGLPEDRSERHSLFKDISSRVYRETGEKVHFTSASPEGLYSGNPSPLIYGILTGYELLYDEEFWGDYLEHIHSFVDREKPVFHQGGESWDIAEMI